MQAMRSWSIVEWGKPLRELERTAPEPRGREVLLRVAACGVCHTDLHLREGWFDLGNGQKARVEDRGVRLPFTLGHEVAGEVVAVGDEVTEVAVGQERVLWPWIGCGHCRFCKNGEELLCVTPRVVGTWRDGGYATHVLVPDDRYLLDHAPLSAAEAAPLACAGITAWSALGRIGALGPDDHLVLLGIGGVGGTALALAPLRTRARIAVVELDAAKRAAAQAEHGVALAVDPRDPDATKQLLDWSGGGVAAVIDFVGRPETARLGAASLRKGGTLVMVGLFGGTLDIPIPWVAQRMLQVRGSFVGTVDDLRALLDLAKAGKLPRLAISTRPMGEADRALDELAEGRIKGRTVLVAPSEAAG